MARAAYNVKIGSTTIGAENFGAPGTVGDPVAASTYAADKTTFEAALAVCVADGASPTQAHVTAANSAYTTFKADLAAPPSTVDLVVSMDLAKIGSLSVLRRALDQLVRHIANSNALTQ